MACSSSTGLFPATMQGEGVEQSVIAALNRIDAEYEDWDCVVIIRGGGATSDLSGFDTLALAENVANFPLPIITGIGHERDESVLDMIFLPEGEDADGCCRLSGSAPHGCVCQGDGGAGNDCAKREAPLASGEDAA